VLKLKIVLGLVAILGMLAVHTAAPSVSHRIAGWTWSPASGSGGGDPDAAPSGWKWAPNAN
jgi:hypothetical protein